ncbi:hypothetical protein KIMH_06660 [Bombiscardovia apis]|uniref:Uncharacterized protein n=1 Tax=Bombiscardovia apis TaxID=2932182 RepID=A0ABM8BC94_9BIFI|nr:hypothetical protein [Bombiscardovia apis]BDR54530.1 hypothetical protein KIMH_06410 [Bombiscardovia apis]BDR54555.1 hypothetical protein KIMH_06660 [Bombiscardovia apis]
MSDDQQNFDNNQPGNAPGNDAQSAPQNQPMAQSNQEADPAQGQVPFDTQAPTQSYAGNDGSYMGGNDGSQFNQGAQENYGTGQVPFADVKEHEQEAKKKTIAIIVAIIAVIAIVAALLVWKPWGVKRADYEEAVHATRLLEEQKATINEYIGKLYKGDKSSSSQDADKLKQAVNKLDKMTKDFGSLKAVKDSAVKDKYQAYSDKEQSYKTYVEGLIDSAPAYAKAEKACGDTSKLTDSDSEDYIEQLNTFIGSCKTGLEQAAKVPNKTISEYTSQAGKVMGKLQDVMKQMTDLINNLNASNANDSLTKMEDLQKEASKLERETPDFNEFNAKLDKEKEKATPEDSLQDLMDTLNARLAQK